MNALKDSHAPLSVVVTAHLYVSRSDSAEASIDDAKAMLIELMYDPANPWSVSILFPDPHWQLSREDLRECVLGSASRGHGDVRISPQESKWTRIDLSSPTGKASLWLDTPVLDDFLFASYFVVPAGHEMDAVDWAYAPYVLLGGASS